jgi:hypothetical protein
MMDVQTQFFITMGLMLATGGLGYYMGERGMAGVKIDLNNIKTDLEKVKTVVTQKTNPQAVTVVTPVTGTEVTNTGTTFATPSL